MNARPSLLLVDDDRDSTALLSACLERFDFVVHCATDGEAMRAQLASQDIDLVVLEVTLPGTDGIALAREIRARSRLPIIMLTARGDTQDRVRGLDSGADDYLVKPVVSRELVARIHAVLRRSKAESDAAPSVAASHVVRFDGWQLHRQQRTVVSPSGLVAALSNAELRLLDTFLQMPRRLLSRDQLMEQARGRAMDAFERSIDLLVSRLRQKLANGNSETTMIKTVRGMGYLFNVQSVQAQSVWRT